MSTTQTLTLIGPGRHGTAIAGLFASHGVNISLFHYKPAKAEAAARQLRPIARNARIDIATSLEEAAQASQFLALTTLWGAPQQGVVSALGDLLDGKILIDVANPLDVTPAGVQMRRPVEGSAGQHLASHLPANVGHVKAFSNLATAAVASSAISQVEWFARQARAAGLSEMWTVGGRARHPSRWHQYVSDKYGRTSGGSFADRLRQVLVRAPLEPGRLQRDSSDGPAPSRDHDDDLRLRFIHDEAAAIRGADSNARTGQ